MEAIDVTAQRGSYRVLVGAGCCRRSIVADEELKTAKAVAVISQQRVLDLHGKSLFRALGRSPQQLLVETIGYGERAKSVNTARRLWSALLRAGFTRDSTIVAFGGGLVGDMAGFIAATILRGVEWVNIPTTLLADVDAAIGGKTGLNLPEGRNLVGAFHPPRRVVVDTDFLSTLPVRQVRSGLGEVAKYAIGIEPALWQLKEQLSATVDSIEQTVATCLRAKARIVMADEFEGGLRRHLNLGHTLGHAIESAAPGRLSHGEAVAVGLRYALILARRLGLASASYVDEAMAVLARLKLRRRPPKMVSFAELEPYLAADKKASRHGLTWILPTGPGAATTCRDVSRPVLEASFTELSTS